MKVLLTGATGYIGKRLLPALIEKEHEVICCVRDLKRFRCPKSLLPHIKVIQLDLLNPSTLNRIPKDIDAAYYLVHSMSASKDYESLEQKSAINFVCALNNTNVQHVVYLGGIVNEFSLSRHLTSRKNVELELGKGNYNFTSIRAGIIIGSGSASFEIIRDLVEKLPIMITPKWLNTKCQPIGIADVIKFLSETLFKSEAYNNSFDVGGPDILTYKEMLLGFAKVRNLKRRIITVPVMTPKLSSYWLYFVTSTSFNLATALVNSMKIEVICRNSKLAETLSIRPLSYHQSLLKAFSKIETNKIISSWKDSQISGLLNFNISDFVEVPTFGCFTDTRTRECHDTKKCINKIWRIGGDNGWYSANYLWRLRGFIDKLFGGVGLRRGRTNKEALYAGDALDFWRVLFASKDDGHLLLFAEMRLPGEAWLEFKILDNKLIQTATFRPRGLLGRLYWIMVYPFHGFVFKGMIKNLTA